MDNIRFLTEKDISIFVEELDKDEDDCISYSEVERKLDDIHREIVPEPQEHHLHHKSRGDEERHQFLRYCMGTDKDTIPTQEFAAIVKSWNIPSVEQDRQNKQNSKDYMKTLPLGRRLRAYWEVNGPQYLFLALVISLQVAFGTWQLVKYLIAIQYRQAFGWGLILAKVTAGALYPTLFFMVLSMSRYFATFARKSYYISRLINWDLSQSFHVKMSIVALVLATLHSIGHLTGSFYFGSTPNRQPAVAAVLGPEQVPWLYIDYVRSTPGWTGLTALGLFYSITLLSMPRIRKKSYEKFQLGHLLMFPMLGMLIAHGTAALLQYPMLGFWLAFPTLLIFIERVLRLAQGFRLLPATLRVLDDETVTITAKIPKYQPWPYKAGQYILLQVPQISFFQWHPFTISTCIENQMQVHIKTDGDWTSKLRTLQKDTGFELKYVGIDGPFGAPAQRFYDFDQTIIVGAGIGVTPFSGILADLPTRQGQRWFRPKSSVATAEKMVGKEEVQQAEPLDVVTDSAQSNQSRKQSLSPEEINIDTYRRVDFHWIVRDRNYLLWFSDLLNNMCLNKHNADLDIRIQTHVTTKTRDMSTHVFRYLLDLHRTDSHPASSLTGLINTTHFGRPDLEQILEEHYKSMQELLARDKDKIRSRKVGVFFCGPPVIGHELADRCQVMTLRGREDRSFLEYHFMIEIFA